MKLISLWEPWATLMALGAKKIETRSWATSYRGWLAIQASKGGLNMADLRSQCFERQFYEALQEFTPFAQQISNDVRHKKWIKEVFPHGQIVAVVKLVDCCPTVDMIPNPAFPCVFKKYPALDTSEERTFGNYERGRWGWVTGNLFRLPEPIPFSAKQGIYDVPEEVVQQLRRQYKGATL